MRIHAPSVAAGLAAWLFALTAPCVVQGASVSLTSDRDTTLFANNIDASNGASPVAFAGKTGTNGVVGTRNSPRRALFHFGLGSVPTNATISSVTLTLNVPQVNAGSLQNTFTLHKLQEDWGEGTSYTTAGAGTDPFSHATTNDATWKYRFYNTSNPTASPAWTTLGGTFASTNSASTTVSDVGAWSFTSAQLAADVQNWLTNPTANFGWILIGDESISANAYQFNTREVSDAALRPTLSITYSVTPEPSSAMLIAGVCAPLLLRRRSMR